MKEIQKQFLTEFDYTLEAANLAEVRENVLGSRDRGGANTAIWNLIAISDWKSQTKITTER
jgi:hypothetical protein